MHLPWCSCLLPGELPRSLRDTVCGRLRRFEPDQRMPGSDRPRGRDFHFPPGELGHMFVIRMIVRTAEGRFTLAPARADRAQDVHGAYAGRTEAARARAGAAPLPHDQTRASGRARREYRLRRRGCRHMAGTSATRAPGRSRADLRVRAGAVHAHPVRHSVRIHDPHSDGVRAAGVRGSAGARAGRGRGGAGDRPSRQGPHGRDRAEGAASRDPQFVVRDRAGRRVRDRRRRAA